MPRGTERAGEERHRQYDHVEHSRGAFERTHEARDRQAEARERRGAECEREDKRQEVRRPRGRLQEMSEHEQRRGLQGEHDHDRCEDRGEVRGGRQRRGPDPLEDPELSPRDQDQRESGERRVGRTVAEHPRQQCPGRRTSIDAAVVDRRQQRKQQQWEEEDEHCRLAAPPEDELIPAQLMEEQPHA